MPTYYGQNGEDAILWSLFCDKAEPGFFVDVGALDGLRFSNTYSFEQEGWKGICVEAHEKYFELLNKNRPNSICVHAAVSDHYQDEVNFYANSRGSLSTLDPTMEDYFRKHFGKYFTGFEVQRVMMRTLNSILEELKVRVSIDLVSIDVEGHEIAVLRGFNLAKYRPQVLVIESIFDEKRREIEAHLGEASYYKARELGGNIFYCRDRHDISKISKASNRIPLNHTPHPQDVNDSQGKRVLNRLT